MKRNIIVILLSTMIITEMFILTNQNKNITIKINDIYNEFEDNNLVVNNKINLDDLIKKKEELKQHTQTVFKNDDIELIFENQNKLTEELNDEISILENTIINLENNLGKLEQEYNNL